MRQAQMEALCVRLSRELRVLFMEIVGWLEAHNEDGAILQMLEAGNYEELIADIEAAATRFASGWVDTYVVAGRAEAVYVDEVLGESVLIDFDQTNYRAVQAIQETRLDIIKGFSEGQQDAVRQAMAEGITNGANPIEQARMIRSSVGLTPYQDHVVENYRRALRSLDRNALERELTDGRHDAVVARAIKAGKPLTTDQVDRYTEAYRRNWIKYRAEVIGRTQGLRAAHEGTEEMWNQAVDSGEVDPADIVSTWHHSGYSRHPRTFHQSMDLQTQPWGTPFVSGRGNELMYPCDPNAPLSETASCACVVTRELLLPKFRIG